MRRFNVNGVTTNPPSESTRVKHISLSGESKHSSQHVCLPTCSNLCLYIVMGSLGLLLQFSGLFSALRYLIYYEASQIIWKQVFSVTDVHAIGK